MKDDQASEEELMGELDLMYQHVAEIESCQAGVEHHHNPNEREQVLDQEASTHAKIIPFPGHRVHLPSGEPSDTSEEEPERKRKPSYPPYLIVGSLFLIFLVFALVIIPLKGMMSPPGSEKGEPHQLAFPIRSTPSPPVQTEEDVLQNIEERQQKVETMPHQTVDRKVPRPARSGIGEVKSIRPDHGGHNMKENYLTGKPRPVAEELQSDFPLTQKRLFTIQVGAFRNWENASQRMDALRKKDLEPYWVEMQSKNRKVIYIVFSGYFTDRNEAAEFLKRKGILNNYPDSYVREISF